MGTAEAADRNADYAEPAPFEAEAAGQRLVFYPAGADRRAALFDLVESARTRLDVCFYIFAEDGVGAQFRDALAAAARQVHSLPGVEELAAKLSWSCAVSPSDEDV